MAEFRTIADYFREVLGRKVRKIPVNAGLGCPGRCIYCNNAAFSPSYGERGSVSEQLAAGVKFSSRKGTVDGYLAFFQSYTNTFGETSRLICLYEEALAYPGVVGLVIATRPDCLADDLLDWFERRFGAKAPQGHPYLLVELGVESTKDETLALIRRGHDWDCSKNAICELSQRGIAVGAHLIVGLPGETQDDFVAHVQRLSELPISTLKLHQLQILRDTPLERMFRRDPGCVDLLSAEGYAQTVRKMLAVLRPDIALDRFVSEVPSGMLVAPRWGLKPSEFEKLL